MQIKRYTGGALPEVLAQIDRELGPNALIIHTRQVSLGGFFGVMGRQGVEVTVAVEYSLRPREDAAPRASAAPAAAPAGPPPGLAARYQVRESAARIEPPPAPVQRVRADGGQIMARRELNEMRVRPRTASASAGPSQALSEEMERIHRLLVRNQVEEYLSRRLLKTFDEQLSLLGEDWATAGPRFEQYISGMIRTSGGIRLREGRKPLVVAFVGPTGVGKTTTIAKVAAKFSLMEHRRVAIITSDTFRIAATDQIRRYGEIIGVPVKVAETPDDLQQLLLSFGGFDLVLLDTAGRSPQNRDQIIHLKQLMEAARPDEIHLVVSMTTKYIDVLSIVAKFGIVPVNRLILTKFDETRTYGLALNLSVNFSMEVAYVTAGQQVPDDIEVADPARLAKLIVGGANLEK